MRAGLVLYACLHHLGINISLSLLLSACKRHTCTLAQSPLEIWLVLVELWSIWADELETENAQWLLCIDYWPFPDTFECHKCSRINGI